MRAVLVLFSATAAHALGRKLCRTPLECGDALDLCGTSSEYQPPLAREELATICLGFHSPGEDEASKGSKALFQVEVDHYATLSVDSLRGLMGASWSQKEKFSQLWVGAQGRRTIGQQRGTRDANGDCNATSTEAEAAAAESAGTVCYGWALHDKPVVTPSSKLSTGLTALIHMDMGEINRIQWDSSCNLCPEAEAPQLACMPDQTDIACVDGACRDCYAQLDSSCTAADAVCAPKVYIAWLGTDKHGQPLLSAGSVLSRFAANSVIGLAKGVVEEVVKLADSLDPGGADPPSDGDDASPPAAAAAPANASSDTES